MHISRHYQHLSATERAMIQIRLLDGEGWPGRKVARRIDRIPATWSSLRLVVLRRVRDGLS